MKAKIIKIASICLAIVAIICLVYETSNSTRHTNTESIFKEVLTFVESYDAEIEYLSFDSSKDVTKIANVSIQTSSHVIGLLNDYDFGFAIKRFPEQSEKLHLALLDLQGVVSFVIEKLSDEYSEGSDTVDQTLWTRQIVWTR